MTVYEKLQLQLTNKTKKMNYQPLSDLVLSNTFTFLTLPEVSLMSRVNFHWKDISFCATSVKFASVSVKEQCCFNKLVSLAKRHGLEDLNVDIDLRNTSRNSSETLHKDLKRIILVLSSHQHSLRKLTWHVPVDRFRVSQGALREVSQDLHLHSSKSICMCPNTGVLLLPEVEIFHFQQLWDSWKFELPNLKQLAVQGSNTLHNLSFRPEHITSLDFGSGGPTRILELILQCKNLETLTVNIGEFTHQEIQNFWNIIEHCTALTKLILWQTDDFMIEAHDVFAFVRVPHDHLTLFYGLHDPSGTQFDTTILECFQYARLYNIRAYIDQIDDEEEEEIYIQMDPDLIQFVQLLEEENIYAPGIARDICDIQSDLLQVAEQIDNMNSYDQIDDILDTFEESFL